MVKNPRASIGAEIRENSKPHLLSPISGLVRKLEKIVISVADLYPVSGIRSLFDPGDPGKIKSQDLDPE